MSGRSVNIVLFLALGVVVALNFLARRDFSRPNLEVLPEMVHSIPFNSFSPNPVFRDGKTMQSPVPGTIPRGDLPLHYKATPEDAARAGRELKNPLADDDPDAARRGAFLFSTYCQHCHGATGLGDGPVARRGFPPPPSLMGEKAVSIPDGRMFHILTYGQGNMPAHALQLTRDDRWRVIVYIRSLQARAAAKTAAVEKP